MATIDDCTEDYKWGVPVYDGGKFYIAAMKSRVHLGFATAGLTDDEIKTLEGTGKTTAEMVAQDTFTDTSNAGLDEAWDFADTWGITGNVNDGYPCLQWQDEGCVVADNAEPEDDNDGISSAVENAAPNGGDANNDGTPDAEQPNVASFVNSLTGQYTVVAVNPSCALESVGSQAETANAVKDAGFNYPGGFTHFSANCGTPGYTTTVAIYQYGSSKDGLVVRKYNPATSGYFTVGSASLSQATLGGKAVVIATYQITDGGDLDTDGTANGTIVDPVGLGQQVVGIPNTGVVQL